MDSFPVRWGPRASCDLPGCADHMYRPTASDRKREPEMTELTLERRAQCDQSTVALGVAMTPPLDENYWAYRVRLSDTQAIVGFPKFFMIGIGFAQEEDWNTNLPYTSTAADIFDHIRHNKGDDAISDADVVTAIELVQKAIRADLEAGE